MSYDVSVGEWSGNFTSNSLGRLCYNHLDTEFGLKVLNGLSGSEATPRLTAFWESLNNERCSLWMGSVVGDPAFCRKYDSPNGWGSLVGALCFMGQLTSACGAYPCSMIEVDA